MPKIGDVAVIIRHCGERTLDICQQLVKEQVQGENITVISEIPFSNAVRKTFEIGMDFHLPWTIAIDADVLISKNAIAEMIESASVFDHRTFKFTAKVGDKLFLKPRQGGIHLYRTSYLDTALKMFPGEEFIRPETHIAEMLSQEKNLQNPVFELIIGIHDYEQWYRDIYRKAFVHANKHGKNYVESFLRNWAKKMDDDLDYKVALIGLCHGIAIREKVAIDIRTLPINYLENELLKDIYEKPPLTEAFFDEDPHRYIDSILFSLNHPRLQELNTLIKRAGPIRVIPGLFFYLINKLSARGYQWATRF